MAQDFGFLGSYRHRAPFSFPEKSSLPNSVRTGHPRREQGPESIRIGHPRTAGGVGLASLFGAHLAGVDAQRSIYDWSSIRFGTKEEGGSSIAGISIGTAQSGSPMTSHNGNSLLELERDAERNRADLMHTVDALQARISPTAIKHDMQDYVRGKKDNFLRGLEQTARDNPVQTVAIAAGAAYPLWRLVTRIPVPLLLIGAGLALTRSSGAQSQTSDQGFAPTAGGRVGHALDAARQGVNDVSEAIVERARDGLGSAQRAAERIAGYAGRASEVAGGVASQVGDSASAGAQAAKGAARDAVSTAGDILNPDRLRRAGTQANEWLDETVGRNPLIVGAVGLAVGAIIATALPSTRRENELLGGAGDSIKRRLGEVALEGAETVRDVATQVYRKAADHAAEEGLSVEDAKALVGQIGDKMTAVVGKVAGDRHPVDDEEINTTRNAPGMAGQAGGKP